MTATWQNHDELLPTLPGKVSGVISLEPRQGRSGSILTLQCAACLRTVTDIAILAVNQINFAAGYELSGGLMSVNGTVPYRRCLDCRTADRHPVAWQEALL